MKKNNGFTLIELMIVLAIVAILAAVSYPSYIEQVIKGKRTDAHTALFNVAQQQEEFFVQKMQYAKDFQTLYGAGAAIANVPSPEGEYDIIIENCADDPCMSYTITATPQAGKSQVRDTKCASLSIDHLGQKTAKNSSNIDASDLCW